MRPTFIYLASPYTHVDAAVRVARYEAACRYAARLMRGGDVVFSPIAHSHPIGAHLDPSLVCDHEFWMRQCMPMLCAADEVAVLCLDGWKDSRGVAREIDEARARRMSIRYIEIYPRAEEAA